MTQAKNDIIIKINDSVNEYFSLNTDSKWIPAKKLMPLLVKNGVFVKDKKNGQPLRQVLRSLDKNEKLKEIPLLHAERVGIDTYWYFVREGEVYVSDKKDPSIPNKKALLAQERANNDENYLINIIDELLEKEGSRKHTFDFLLGDLHQNGKKRTKLPIDVYYKHKRLAIEIMEHPQSAKSLDEAKESKLTVSGITRAEQRIKYNDRKKKTLEQRSTNYLEVSIDKFDVDENFKLKRDKSNDERVLRAELSRFID